MDYGVYVLVEVLPNGAVKVVEVFSAECQNAAEEYAAQRNVSELDKHVQRFRVQGPFSYAELDFDPEDGRYFLGL